MTPYSIERGTPGLSGAVRAVERAAGVRFRDIGMGDIADSDPTPAGIIEDRAAAGRLYVARGPESAIAGFLIWSPKDGCAYIEEVSVHPDHAGHRLAQRLIDALAADARGRYGALTLATFREVAWNAPYYRRLGFAELPRAEIGAEHAESWRRQSEHGLDMTRRLFMIRPLAA